MNDVVVKVLVPVDPNADASVDAPKAKVTNAAAPPGYEEVRETLPGIFSLKVLKYNLCKRRYWNPDHYRLLLRVLEDEVVLDEQAGEDEVDSAGGDDAAGGRKGGGRGQAQAPLADRKEGMAGGAAGGPRKLELWTWLKDEDACVMDVPGLAGGGEVYLEERAPGGGWPTDRYDPATSARLKAQQQQRREANERIRAKRLAPSLSSAQPKPHSVFSGAGQAASTTSATTDAGRTSGQQPETTQPTVTAAAPSGWSSFLQKGREHSLLSGAQTTGGWYDDEDEWEKPQPSGYPAFSAPPGYQMSEEEQLQAAMMLSRVQADEDADKEQDFEGLMLSKGLLIKQISDDGNCLFGAIADQVYADPALHAELRKQCLDYMEKDRDHFSQFVTEDFEAYVLRKRCLGVYANNPEIQALSEMLGRPIEVYSYASEPMNTFQGQAAGSGVRPVRISYHRGNHYNSLQPLDPGEDQQRYAATPPPPVVQASPAGATAGTAAGGATTQPAPVPASSAGGGEGENVCFLCGQQCVDYEDLQIHMFTTCAKKDLL